MTNNMATMNDMTTQSLQNDEIDLLELIRTLWKHKVQIIVITALTTLLAAMYAFTAKQQWTSKATVIAPRLTDMGDYLAIRREYNRILQIDAIDPSALSENLFTHFSELARSIDIRNAFFIQSDIYNKLTEGKSEFEKNKILFDLSNKATKFIIPDAKKEPNSIGYLITFYAENPQEAKNTLVSFINFVNFEASKVELNNYLIDFENTLKSLKYEKLMHDENVSLFQKVQLDYLNKAYETANRAGIEDYYRFSLDEKVTNSSPLATQTQVLLGDSQLFDSSYLFMLGKKYIKAQIEAINERGKIYPTRYYQIDSQIKQLEPLLEQIKQIKIKTYQYHASPDYPVIKDYPKRGIILIMGMVLGILGVVLFIIMSYFIRRITL